MRALLVFVLLAGCYRGAERDEALEQRIARLEQRLDAQDKAIADARARSDTTELSLLAKQVAELQQKLAEVKTGTAAAPVKRREPDRAATYAVPINQSPVLGSPKAKVTLVMALEFDCPYCRRAYDTVDELRKKYGKELRVVYKPYVVHRKTATQAAHGACAAQRQGRWRQMADLIWAKAFDMRGIDSNAFDQAHIDAIAKDAGLDMARYQADISGPCPAELQSEMALLVKLGVSATPSFFINGRYMSGARPIEEFTRLIDEEMAKATAAHKRGVKAERYYDDEIVAKGLTQLAPPP